MSSRPKILLVDDREENLLALEGLLREQDAELLPARSGRAALELLLRHEVALALVDVQMPELDGFELAELMRGTERTREVPIVFISAGLHDQARIFRGYESGAVDFLLKPLDPHALRSKVAVFLTLDRQKRLLAERVRELEAALAERQRAEEALREANRRKDEFLAMLSHELRNPLAPIRNSLYILERAEPGGAQASRAQAVIERQVQHMTRLIDDLLDVTRISRGKIRLQRERLELNGLVRRVADDHREQFTRNGVALEVAICDEPLHVEGDPTRLAQVVGNLLQNAAKFTPRGGRARLSLRRSAEGSALVQVRDDGAGIAPETLSELFEPFVQAETSLDRSHGGLGLGLALAKNLVELHGGEVRAASPGLGQGAEFTVCLPLAPAAEAKQGPASQATVTGGARRVLLIEDNVDAAETLREALELGGHRVEVALTGPEGLAKARALKPEVVLCDIGLPQLDGYAVARAIRSDPELRSAQLVALSGYALPEDVQRSREAGFDKHMVKPPDMGALQALLAGERVGSL